MEGNLKVLKFFEGKKGVVSKLPSGKIVLVNRNSSRYPRNGEKWLCRLDFERENFAVATPLTKEVLIKSVYSCGHSEIKRVSISEAGSEVKSDNVKLVGGDAVVEYYYPFYCSECSKEEDATARKTVEEKLQTLEEEYDEWRKSFFSKGLEIRKCFESDFFEDIEPLITVDRQIADAISMKTVEEEAVQELKDKYGIDDIEDLYFADLEKYTEFYEEFMNAVKEKAQKLVNDGFVPAIVRNVEERQKYVVDENIGYQLRGEYAFVRMQKKSS